MAYIVLPYTIMASVVIACTFWAYTFMSYIVLAYMTMACTVLAYTGRAYMLWQELLPAGMRIGLYSFGL